MANKLIVCGCSYSDRTYVDSCYGDYLSSLLNREYVHLAKGGTSNDRIWRKITEGILSNQIDSNDIVVAQYTDIHRREFPSLPGESKAYAHEKAHSTVDFDDFYVVSDYKIDSHTWMTAQQDINLHCAYQSLGASTAFDSSYFMLRHLQFSALCKIYNINLVIYVVRYINDNNIETGFLNMFDNLCVINEKSFSELFGKNHRKYELGYAVARQRLSHLANQGVDRSHQNVVEGLDPSGWDTSHLSNLGHQYVANCLAENLKYCNQK